MDSLKYERLVPPVDSIRLQAMCRIWEAEFNTSYAEFKQMLAGIEPENQFVLRAALIGDEVAGTCQITRSGDDPTIGGVGEVVVPERFRRRGIGSQLFEESCTEFFESGGQALFLGTENPAAARIYHRYGFRCIPSTENMGRVSTGTPESFLYEYFQSAAVDFNTVPLGRRHRVQLIPFLMAPHEMVVLDQATGFLSSRHQVLHGCMSLYSRFDKLVQSGGQVFVTESSNHRIQALVTACRHGEQAAVDGFALPGAYQAWSSAVQAATNWAGEMGSQSVEFSLAVEDDVKRQWVESLGISLTPSDQTVNIAGRDVACLVGQMAPQSFGF